MQDFISKRIRVFRNGDIFTDAKKFVVSPRIYRNFEQFLLSASNELKLLNGAVRRVYDINGRQIHGLEDIVEGGAYIATGGEFFKRAPYLLKDQAPPPTRPKKVYAGSKTFLASEPTSSTNGRKEVPIFTTTSKAFRVVVYANGDATSPGARLLLNHRTCSKYEQLLRTLSDVLRLQSGSVRRIYDIKTGKQIKQLRDLYEGQCIAGSVSEAFKNVAYKPRTAVNKGQSRREPDEVRRVVTFYPNGDSHHNGFTITVQKSRFHTLKKLITFINSKYKLVNGLAGRIVATGSGETIIDISQLEHNRGYVLVSGDDAFCNIVYNINRVGPKLHRGMDGYTQNNNMMSKIKGVKNIWETEGWKANAAANAAAKGNKNAAKTVVIKRAAPVKHAQHHDAEIIEEDEAVQEAVADDHDAVYESQELNSFNPVEAQEAEIEIGLEDNEPALQNESEAEETEDEQVEESEQDDGEGHGKLVGIDIAGVEAEEEEFEPEEEEIEAEEEMEAEDEEEYEEDEEVQSDEDLQEEEIASEKFASVPDLPSRDQSNLSSMNALSQTGSQSQSLSKIPVRSTSTINP